MTIRDAEYNCRLCKNKYSRRSEEIQESHQRKKGCFSTFNKPILEYLPKYSMRGNSKILYNHCPARFYDGGVAELISYHSKFESGIMPYSGGFYQQPSKFVEIMELIHNLINEYKEEQQKSLEKHGRQRSKS